MSFADSFWSNDYELGFKVLFDQLYEGISENEDFIQLFNKRMDLELLYGTQLEAIDSLISNRQSNDDYVSLIKNAYQKLNENFTKQGEQHLQIASNIRTLVLIPFTQWCKDHKQRVDYSESMIFDKHKQFKSSKTSLEKTQKKYFNKCRMLEEFKSHYSEEELNQELQDIEFAKSLPPSETDETEENDETYEIGGSTYDRKAVISLLTDIIKSVELKTHKVPILGTYHNVSTGSSISLWLLENIPELNNNIVRAEEFGQGLIANGFLRIIGSMSTKTFINSSQFFYQWKPVVFEMTKLKGTEAGAEGDENDALKPVNKASIQLLDYFEDMKQAIGVNTVDFTDKTQLAKLINDVNQLDTLYFYQTCEVDKLRCEFEELIMDHLAFMQKCELDRLKAVKKATFDFLSSFSNKITSMKALCDELIIIEETINPVNDLKLLVENYATGSFKPHVVLYDNYYKSNINQTFGVDLNVKSRLDKKVVPIIIQCILSHLDSVYPEIESDEERINLWTQPIQLSQVHTLRFSLNDVHDSSAIKEVLKGTNPLVITNVLKLYFMELPDSIIPYNYYDLIKSLYSNYPISDESKTQLRINGLQNVLIDLPKCNLATLDLILTHLNRLIQIIGSKNPDLSKRLQLKLSKEFGNLILKPKFDSFSLTLDSLRQFINDKHQFNLINDLFEYKETIFTELRRRNSTRVKSESNGNSSSRLVSSSRGTPTESSNVTPRSLVSEKSKSRLEAKLQRAVHKSGTAGNSSLSDTNTNKGTGDDTSRASRSLSDGTVVASIVTPPDSPKKSASSTLKRSTSPNKKKLNALLYEDKKPATKITPSKVVSLKPSKKDIIYDAGDTSEAGEFAQPTFANQIGRKSSVKDLASQYDSLANDLSMERSLLPPKVRKSTLKS